MTQAVTSNDGHVQSPSKKATFGLFVAGACGVVVGGLYAVATPFVLPAFRRVCLPYVPATSRQVQNVFKILAGRTGTLVDLGSGDGRIVIDAAKHGYKSTGYELNPWLVWYSKLSAARNGVSKNAHFYRTDLWKTDLSNSQNVVIFGVSSMMQQLEQKLVNELQPGAAVVACRFPFTSWSPSHTIDEGIDSVWLYDITKVLEENNKDNVDTFKAGS
ncbi:ATP synthase subunit C lysine N-methyltransferase-like [Anneissia japonica]|uniref:ATP synthase subunit C lysine N-methyltransferase-like n=1 Tax=Anneissia japonica TaxID=1529436 RepID=UPI0014258FC8|nr:ATP synthase subunit C lysine N-methyltransferase-like [Anneissia japonica]